MRIDELLMHRQVPHQRLHHSPAYTAHRIAQLLHVPGKELAKSVLLRTTDGYTLAVLPATHYVDLERMRQELQDDDIDLASEGEMQRVFPDCETGAMPPFGSLYNVPTIVDDSLAEDEEIVFEGPTHEEAIRMAYRDYEEVEHPRHGRFARRW
ncbi:MAG: YbaK/EbsC family protein [Gemmataceae bacterium]|nr:YbaK/EbsC family protein [Gemmataceae bacterium]MCI0742127.1 YbaK/EbsC family protein [Gemmataceae bacterium]